MKSKKAIIILAVVVLIIIVSVLSYTYAYFAFSSQNANTITGTAATPKIELNVEKIIPTSENSNLKLIPLLDTAISKAVAGTGGQSSCIDANGNLSCQIYKITVQNTGNIRLRLKGTIELAANGSNNIFGNLKWQQLENSTTVKAGTTAHTMETSTLENNISINVNETKTFYFALWISEINQDQKELDYGDFIGTITFMDDNGKGATATFDS